MLALSNLNEHVLTILQRCSHLKQLQAYLTVLGHSQTQLHAFKLVRFCTITLSNLTYARAIFNQLTHPNVVYFYAAMITAYASQPDHVSSIVLYRNMFREENTQPNQFVYPYALKSFPEVMVSLGTEMEDNLYGVG
ncbi:hypothetical protein RJ639_008966 [Escallonia herrerae]|uniref:Pentatricopeptide repeat-containing protein n=1 Tax=Escallonia herrerae TaxID=1293975 RepID=A0AA89AWK6_9ASTE|nr:hypothetical protein RJ639_008966 [Escallonia herrerae]